MATIVLTAVGTIVGGPIGGAIGALVGQAVDSALFAPKARQGPRLGELAVQTSNYGGVIPKIFGTLRVAGTVIWATDLIERRATSGGGKGRPKTVNYSYSASFAVALSGRAAQSIGRIWADGKLLRGAAGDFKSETAFRFHPGSEDQAVDPLIASAEGVGNMPAFRGVAYAVFEDFQLADYGNRIPSLTFEVIAEPGPIAIGAMASELSENALAAGVTPSVAGFAASGDSVRGAIEELASVTPLSLVDDGAALCLAVPSGSGVSIPASERDARGLRGGGGRGERTRRSSDAVPSEVSVSYYEPARDWQTGLQRATLGGPGIRVERVALPAALVSDIAKAFAERRLAALQAARTTATVHAPVRRSVLRAGEVLAHDDVLWKIERKLIDRMVVTLDLVRMPGGSIPSGTSASPGRSTREPDLAHGPSVIHLLDLPSSADAATDRVQLLAAAAGTEPGWRRANLSISYDAGFSWEAIGQTAAPAVMGIALVSAGPGDAALIDARNSIEVELLHEGMWLEGRDDEALVNGANVALLGNELIQFGMVEAIGPRRFRLSRLLRGRRGTEWACDGHAIGERFVLIEPEALVVMDLAASRIGASVRIMAQGIGDGAVAPQAAVVVAGEGVRPPSPVRLHADWIGADLRISWVRRSRSGWIWMDHGDAPLAEESERYELRFSGDGFARTTIVAEPQIMYDAAQQASDGGGPLTVAVRQLGMLAASRESQIIIPRN